MKMKKKTKIIAASAAAAAVLIIGIIFFVVSRSSSSGDTTVYVRKVSDVSGSQGIAVQKYAGIVKEQDSVSVKKSSDKKVEELYVEVGQEVKAGDALFKYDVTETERSIETAKLDIEELDDQISALTTEINELTAQKAKASSEEQFTYTTTITEKQISLRTAEYDKQSKQTELTRLQQEVANAVVTSTVSGTIKAINESSDSSDKPYISISQSGDFRVKGSLDETSMGQMTLGQNVLIRSRTDESRTWSGVITEISSEPQSSDTSYSSGDSSSQYPFYVSLAASDGLMLGQHVFIEPDYGQAAMDQGIWLDRSYVIDDGDSHYVWTSENDKLKKTAVELGVINESANAVEITSGLNVDDYIAWPSEDCKEGMQTTKDETSAG